ncbi:hypothetical protein SELMODRAFT_403271 [Selaginella moellendorffii]|uniref:Uncharacterized protein n=1 Tax=Selaginella moellendorffii TaxID=88036 RepID=D8QTM2_SELML|nr:hypothetical protein SELMODRAFT_403271 [Selaginella moellendorffii]
MAYAKDAYSGMMFDAAFHRLVGKSGIMNASFLSTSSQEQEEEEDGAASSSYYPPVILKELHQKLWKRSSIRVLSSSSLNDELLKVLLLILVKNVQAMRICISAPLSAKPDVEEVVVDSEGVKIVNISVEGLSQATILCSTNFVTSSKSVSMKLRWWHGKVLERQWARWWHSMSTDINNFFPDIECHESISCGVGYIDVIGVNLQLKNDLLIADLYKSLDLVVLVHNLAHKIPRLQQQAADHSQPALGTLLDEITAAELAWEEYGDDIWRLMDRLSEIYYEELSKVHSAGPQEWLAALYSAGVPCAVASTMDQISLLNALIRMGLDKSEAVRYVVHGFNTIIIESRQLSQKRMEWTPPRIGSWILCPRDQRGRELDPLSQRLEWPGFMQNVVVVTHHSRAAPLSVRSLVHKDLEEILPAKYLIDIGIKEPLENNLE